MFLVNTILFINKFSKLFLYILLYNVSNYYSTIDLGYISAVCLTVHIYYYSIGKAGL